MIIVRKRVSWGRVARTGANLEQPRITMQTLIPWFLGPELPERRMRERQLAILRTYALGRAHLVGLGLHSPLNKTLPSFIAMVYPKNLTLVARDGVSGGRKVGVRACGAVQCLQSTTPGIPSGAILGAR
jgi:hypothetical protein